MHELLAAQQGGRMQSYRPRLEGRIVLIGSVMRFDDRKLQPLQLARWEDDVSDAPGLILHAQALRSIFGPGLIAPSPWALPLALSLLCALLWFVPVAPLRTALLLVLPGAGLLSASVALTANGRFLPPSLPLAAAWLAVGGRLGYEAVQRLRQRRHLRSALEGYLGPQVLGEIVAGRLSAAFEGKRYLVCVMFVDMRDFTPRSESMEPEALVRLLNRWFEELVACVHHPRRHRGEIPRRRPDGVLRRPQPAAQSVARGAFRRQGDVPPRGRSQRAARGRRPGADPHRHRAEQRAHRGRPRGRAPAP
jgi:adenylate cyclase